MVYRYPFKEASHEAPQAFFTFIILHLSSLPTPEVGQLHRLNMGLDLQSLFGLHVT
jgi:hypothetical protein